MTPPPIIVPWTPSVGATIYNTPSLPPIGFYRFLRCRRFRGDRLLALEWLMEAPDYRHGEVVVSFV